MWPTAAQDTKGISTQRNPLQRHTLRGSENVGLCGYISHLLRLNLAKEPCQIQEHSVLPPSAAHTLTRTSLREGGFDLGSLRDFHRTLL